MGDDFVRGGFPFVDVANGGSVSGMISGVAKVLDMVPADVKVIPGHGPLSTPADLRKFLDMLRDTRALVSEAAQQGRTSDQMKKDHILSKYESLGTRFIKTDVWIDLLYSDVTHKSTELDYMNHGHANEHVDTSAETNAIAH